MTISISFCFRAISMDNDYTTRVAKKTWPKKMSKINCPAIYFLSLWQMMTKDYFLHKEGGWNLEFDNLLPSKDATVMTHESPPVKEWKQNRGKVWQPSILSFFYPRYVNQTYLACRLRQREMKLSVSVHCFFCQCGALLCGSEEGQNSFPQVLRLRSSFVGNPCDCFEKNCVECHKLRMHKCIEANTIR